MMSNAKALLLTLLLACRALAAPIDSTGTPTADIQAVIDALKHALEIENPTAASMVYDIERQLRTNGALSEEAIIALDNKIHSMSPNGVIDPAEIAATTIEYLSRRGAFDTVDKEDIEGRVTVLTTDLIDSAVKSGTDVVVQDCPHKGRLCGGCVIL